MPFKFTCEQCGTSFERARRTSYKGLPYRFCSHSCSGIFRQRPQEDRFWAKVGITEDPNGCWLWRGATLPAGYGHLRWNDAEQLTHRISWEIVHGPIPEGMFVCHNCPHGDNPTCVNPRHLFLGTRADNAADMVRKGRSARGERHSQAKLTAGQVREIRKLRMDGLLHREIALRFGVTKSCIQRVLSGESWKCV